MMVLVVGGRSGRAAVIGGGRMMLVMMMMMVELSDAGRLWVRAGRRDDHFFADVHKNGSSFKLLLQLRKAAHLDDWLVGLAVGCGGRDH